MTRNLLTILITILLFQLNVQASECYHYHTSKRVEIKVKNHKNYLVVATIDPNGVSIASELEVALPLPTTDLQLKFKDSSSTKVIIEDDTTFYCVSVPNFPEDNIKVFKIAEKNRISSFLNSEIVCIDGKWMKLNPDFYRDTLTLEIIENLPDKTEVISQYKDRSYILKSEDNLYTFYPADKKIKKINGINAAELQIMTYSDGIHSGCLLTDGNTFLQITFPWLEIINKNNLLEKFNILKPYKTGGIYTPYLSQILEINNVLFEISGEEILIMNDIHWYNDQNILLEKNGKVYLNAIEAKFERNTTDVSQVANLDSLHLYSKYLYNDGTSFYNYDHDNNKFISIPNLPINVVMVTGVTSYMHPTTWFYDDGKQLIYIDSNYKIHKKISHNKNLKDLKIAYVFDDKILIENKIIPHYADYNTLSFVGSTVDIISPCDGGHGQIPIQIEYNYFFKDKNKAYAYHTGDNELTVIESISPSALDNSSYEDWLQLKRKAGFE